MPTKPLNDVGAEQGPFSSFDEIEPMYLRGNAADNELGPIGCRVLAGSSLLGRLTELNLNNNKLKDIGVKALANADLQAIEDLSLSKDFKMKMIIR